MTIQQPETALESVIRRIDQMSADLQVLRRTVVQLLGETTDGEVGVLDEPGPKRSIVDILAAAPGHRIFQSAADVDQYLSDERGSWDS